MNTIRPSRGTPSRGTREKHAAAIALAVLVALGLNANALGQAGRGAGTGAAAGAVFSFLLGGDLGDVLDSAAVGAATGAAAGAVSEGFRTRQRERAELNRLRRQEIQMLEAERARERDSARQQLETERRALAEERRRLEQTLASARAEQTNAAPSRDSTDSGWPETEAEWVAAIGEDNFRAFEALVGCQYERASLLAQAGRTTDNPDFHLASRWIDALAAVDSRNNSAAELLFEELVILDDDVDTVQQASLQADQSILEVRRIRREENIDCRA